MHRRLAALLAAVLLLVTFACAPAATPPPPTAAAKPTAAPAAPVPPTTAPAAPRPTEVAPTAKPAASPQPDARTAPAAAPAKPAGSPDTTAGTAFNEQAIADFYRGKTVRIVVGFAPGGGYDLGARLIAKYLPSYLPGSPTVIVENKPGAGGVVASNGVYNVEPKDGTVISAFVEQTVLLQVVGGEGIQFDASKMQWLGSLTKATGVCYVRTDAGITDLAQLVVSKKVVNTPSPGRGTGSNTVPAVVNGALGTNFKLITGYEGYPAAKNAFAKNEGEALCTTSDVLIGRDTDLFEGSAPVAKMLFHFGGDTPDLQHPLLKGVPNAETLATSEEGKQLIRAVNAPFQMYRPYAVAPGVPADRVGALRAAFQKIFADSQFAAEAQKAVAFVPNGAGSGEQVAQVVAQIGQLPEGIRTKLKDIL